jgi:peptidoglycan hydrolase-like protein with peptidoglycan-binding domain
MIRRRYRRVGAATMIGSLVIGITVSGVVAYQQLDVAEAAGAPTGGDPSSDEPDVASGGSGPETARVTTVDLVDEDEVAGELGYGEPTELRGEGGVITRVPDPGELLELGEAAWDVDGHAGPAVIFGELPQWRRLDINADDGPDILQLEYNLARLGFHWGTVDEDFDADTRRAIRDWQESRGLERTGVVEIGDVVVVPDPVRVDELLLAVGERADGGVLTVTDVEQLVTIPAEIDELDLFEVGDEVLVELPDDRRVGGTVREIANTATASEDGSVTVEVIVALDAPEPALVAAPVAVIVQKTRVEGAVVVPIRALLALAEGGYAVERVTGSTTTLIGVEIGAFGDGVVQITSEQLADGDTVVVAP